MSSSDFLRNPHMMELRLIERDGTRWLQQWRNKPGGYAYEFEWVDVAELPWPPLNVRKLKPPLSGS